MIVAQRLLIFFFKTSGFSYAAEFINILSEHLESNLSAISKFLMPPPHVIGTKQFFEINLTILIKSLISFLVLEIFKIINSSIK